MDIHKYIIILLNFIYPDIDECRDGTDDCTQTCTNTDGSFTCGCNTGYLLDTDGFTCNGKYKHACILTCVHTCSTNTNGSFNCGCNNGYLIV